MPRYLSQQMEQVRFSEWRFEPAGANGLAPDRVEWSFTMNPYAGGEQRSFVRPHMEQRIFGAHRPVTIEARLYLSGEYQTMVEQQATSAVPTIRKSPQPSPASRATCWVHKAPIASSAAGSLDSDSRCRFGSDPAGPVFLRY
jgi:hypothetical protein